jgi:outer membrane protein TolC
VRDAVIREVVEAATRARSLAVQLETSKKTLATAAEAQKLAEQRKEFGVGVVLEDIQTQQDLTRERNDFVGAVAEYDKAQYALQKAVGAALNSAPPPAAK